MNTNPLSTPTSVSFPFPPPSFPPLHPSVIGSNLPCSKPQFFHRPATLLPPSFPWPPLHRRGLPPWAVSTSNQEGSVPVNITVSPAPSSTVMKIQILEDVDKVWLAQFKLNCQCRQHNEQCMSPIKGNAHKITNVKSMHVEAHTIINYLEKMTKSNRKDDRRMNELKGKLDDILLALSDGKTVASLANQGTKRMKKRTRQKRKWHVMYLEQKQREKRIKDKHKEGDEWLEKGRKVEENLRREKQVQKELDSYLQEVRQRQTEINKSLELLASLARLRKARKESTLCRGQKLPSDDHDEIFSCVCETARGKLMNGHSFYEKEEKKLRVFLVEEQKLEEKRRKKKKATEEKEKREGWNERRWEVLFGSKDELNVSNPMWPTEQLHKQASGSLLTLAHTRQQWDQFIDGSGSRIPTHWVEPTTLPPREMWAEHCDETSVIED